MKNIGWMRKNKHNSDVINIQIVIKKDEGSFSTKLRRSKSEYRKQYSGRLFIKGGYLYIQGPNLDDSLRNCSLFFVRSFSLVINSWNGIILYDLIYTLFFVTKFFLSFKSLLSHFSSFY